MNKNLEKIRTYLINKGVSEQRVNSDLTSSVYLAMMIMEYAHRDQKRENGEDYVNHPFRCLYTYRNLIGIGINGDGLMDKDLLYQNNIPFDGVQEVLLLHDVVEDSEFTLDDVRDIYVDCGFETYFDMYIKTALKCITHDEAVDYSDYIQIVLKNPISALVKIIDIQDNLRILDLIKFNEDRYHRAEKYLYYSYIINKKYHFVENIENYKKQFKEDAE